MDDSAPAATSAAPAAVAPAVVVKDLNFTYGAASKFKPVLTGLNMELPRGSRTLLCGDNGAGKSTILRILAGRHIHPEDAVMVLGRQSFFDTSVLNEKRSYMGTDWGRRTVAFSGHNMPLMADIAVSEMMSDLQQRHLPRRDELVQLLGIDLNWRMHQLSDGQRRRVQIMLQLLAPCELLLLDEITTDLDLCTRQDFLNHLRDMSEKQGVTIVYATHIFDGLDDWPTHLAFVDDGKLARFGTVASYDDLQVRRSSGTVAPLLRTVEAWMRANRDAKRAAGRSVVEKAERAGIDELRGESGNGYLSGRIASAAGHN